jgi:endo-1,4-beta-xylanase
MLTRRAALAGLASAAAVPVLAQAPIPPGDTSVSLGAVAAQVGIRFGTAFDREIFADAPYRAIVARESRIATTENSLKFDWLRPRGPTPDYGVADQLVEFARRNDIALRGTALVWNDWPPAWLRTLSNRELASMMDRHIDEVLTRYRGRIQSWDVVNEPFFPPHRREGGYRQGPWLTAMGKDYVPRAFRRAAAADPSTKLVLNEAFMEQEDELGLSIRPRFLRLVDEMQQAGVPLHAVGFQGHLKPHLPGDDQRFVAYLREFERRGLDIYITELDVDDQAFPDDLARRDEMVARRHFDFLSAVLTVPAVKVVIAWHLSDKYSWYATADWHRREVAARGGTAGRPVRTHVLDADHRPKAAWHAVQRALAARTVRPA